MATAKPTKYEIWAAGATGGNVIDPDVTTPGKFANGWIAEVPAFEHFNFLQQLFTQGLVYNNEQGINEWDEDTVYPINGLVKGPTNGRIYKAQLEQGGNNPESDDGTNWIENSGVFTTVEKMLAGIRASDIGKTVVWTEYETGYGYEGGNSGIVEAHDAGNTYDLGSLLRGTVDTNVCVRGLFKNGVNAMQFGASPAASGAATRAAIQAALLYADSVFLPDGDYASDDTILLGASNKKLWGNGFRRCTIDFENDNGGVAFSGDEDKTLSEVTYSYCELSGFKLNGGITTGFTIGVDLTSFSYSRFDLEIECKRANAQLYYGQGNNGASPYYNDISGALNGFTDRTQDGIVFAEGIDTSDANGPNANVIHDIIRAASLRRVVDLQTGEGNLFSNINGESIGDAYYVLNERDPDDSGTSTGSNDRTSLNDTGQAWTSNEYTNFAVEITGGTGAGQVRRIRINTGTSLTVSPSWGVIPDNTSTYEIFAGKAIGNQFTNLRGEGSASLNPDCIRAMPGTRGTKVTANHVTSLGTGLIVDDRTGNPSNQLHSGYRVIETEFIENPGAGANITIYNRSGAAGGVRLPGDYVLEWVSISARADCSDDATVTLDAGGGSPGNGAMTIVCTLSQGETDAYKFRDSSDTGNGNGVVSPGYARGIFINLTTGASFSATEDLQITWCATVL